MESKFETKFGSVTFTFKVPVLDISLVSVEDDRKYRGQVELIVDEEDIGSYLQLISKKLSCYAQPGWNGEELEFTSGKVLGIPSWSCTLKVQTDAARIKELEEENATLRKKLEGAGEVCGQFDVSYSKKNNICSSLTVCVDGKELEDVSVDLDGTLQEFAESLTMLFGVNVHITCIELYILGSYRTTQVIGRFRPDKQVFVKDFPFGRGIPGVSSRFIDKCARESKNVIPVTAVCGPERTVAFLYSN